MSVLNETVSSVFKRVNRVFNTDGWTNVLTGLGVQNKDKLVSSQAQWRQLTEQEAEELYASDEIATKIVNMPVEESFRAGYTLTGVEHDVQKKIMDRVKALEVNESLAEGWIKGRLYGGSGVLLVTDDFQKLAFPLSPGARLKALNVLSRWELTSLSDQIETDLMRPDYGLPRNYTFNSRIGMTTSVSQSVIHASRLVRFDGAWLPDRLRRSNGYWYDSVLSKTYDPLRNYNVSHDSAAATLQDFSVAVFKLKNLANLLDTDGDDTVLARLHLVNLTKSIMRAVVIDEDGEDFDHKTRSVTGMKELLDKIEMRLVASTPMPHTVLLGNSPSGGLSSNGSHEQNNWYDYVRTQQVNYLKPKLMVIIAMIAREFGVDPEAIDIEFNPLWQPTEKEQADVRRTQAETDVKYIEAGVIDPVEVALSRFGGDKYNTATNIDVSLRKAITPKPLDPFESESDRNAAVAGARP